MQAYTDVLKSVRLFEGIDECELASLLACLGGRVLHAKKDEFVLLAGDKATHIGILLQGALHVIKEDSSGERILVAALTPGSFFAEALCCAGVEHSPVSVAAQTDSAIMLLEFQKILRTCESSCAFHTRLIKNMLFVIAEKNLMLQSRLEFLGKRTLRMKILGYLESYATEQGRQNIMIPLNREELADFFCVDRSALSHELARMKKDGVLDYHKNCFRLLHSGPRRRPEGMEDAR